LQKNISDGGALTIKTIEAKTEALQSFVKGCNTLKKNIEMKSCPLVQWLNIRNLYNDFDGKQLLESLYTDAHPNQYLSNWKHYAKLKSVREVEDDDNDEEEGEEEEGEEEPQQEENSEEEKKNIEKEKKPKNKLKPQGKEKGERDVNINQKDSLRNRKKKKSD